MLLTLNTYEAQIICIIGYYNKDIIETIKKNKSFLINNNFSTVFFDKHENRNKKALINHINNIAVNNIINWYIVQKTKNVIRYLIECNKKCKCLVEIHPKEYYYEEKKRFNFIEILKDISLLYDFDYSNVISDYSNDNVISDYSNVISDDNVISEYSNVIRDDKNLFRRIMDYFYR